MSSNYVNARDAIEAIVATKFPNDDQLRWSSFVPTDNPPGGWGMTGPAWQSMATMIVRDFNSRIAPRKPISVGSADKAAAGGKILVEFQAFIAALADRSASVDVIEKFRA